MAKSRTTPSRSPSQRFVASLGFSHGNGSTKAETDAERLARIETLLERITESLETQFKRMAEMQGVIDRLSAERRR